MTVQRSALSAADAAVYDFVIVSCQWLKTKTDEGSEWKVEGSWMDPELAKKIFQEMLGTSEAAVLVLVDRVSPKVLRLHQRF